MNKDDTLVSLTLCTILKPKSKKIVTIFITHNENIWDHDNSVPTIFVVYKKLFGCHNCFSYIVLVGPIIIWFTSEILGLRSIVPH